MTKNPDTRPSARVLLSHAFVAGALPNSCLHALIEDTLQLIQAGGGREEALGLNEESDVDGTDGK